MINQSRRDFLKATTAAALTAAIEKDGWSRRAFAQQTGHIPASEWDYRTTKELVEALQGRKISAIELTDHVIARIEAVDPQINAVVVRDFDRAREAAKMADAALSRGGRFSGFRWLLKNPSMSPVCRRPGAYQRSRTGLQRKMLSQSLASSRQAPSS